jgi:hypothetical protein
MANRSSFTTLPFILLTAIAPLAGLGCGICDGTEDTNTKFHAAYASSTGDSLSADGTSGSTSWWNGAINDAASVSPPRFGLMELSGNGTRLAFALRFPLSAGQTIPFAGTPAAGSFSPFTTAPTDDSTLAPFTDTAPAWLPPVPGPDEAAQRDQTWQGSVTVTSAQPLRLQMDATVSYPADSGRPPVRLDGAVTFTVEQSLFCRD